MLFKGNMMVVGQKPKRKLLTAEPGLVCFFHLRASDCCLAPRNTRVRSDMLCERSQFFLFHENVWTLGEHRR